MKSINRKKAETEMKRPRLLRLALAAWQCFQTINANSNFDPYQLNGGLIAGVAGKDYVIIAGDSRLSRGYEILSRDYLDSRVWRASSAAACGNEYECVMRGEGKIAVNVWDGGMVGSSGCVADCDALKRMLQSEIMANAHWAGSTLSVSQLSSLLSNVLYSRRNFPFYSFCVTGGLEQTGHGVLYVYDAIGSKERVAVAAAGSGKEMLQPVLDRLFSISEENLTGPPPTLRTDGSAISHRYHASGLALCPPVQTHVHADLEEAVALLLDAYRSVAEREITVGDSLVLCILTRDGSGESCSRPARTHHLFQKNGFFQVRRFPLKEH